MSGRISLKRKEPPSATITRPEDEEEGDDIFEKVTKRKRSDKGAFDEWTAPENSPTSSTATTVAVTPVISLGGDDDGDDEDDKDPFSMADLTQKRVVTVPPSQKQHDENNNKEDHRPIPYPVPPKYIETPPGRDTDLPVLLRRGVPVKDCFAYSQITKYKKRYLTTLEQKVAVEAERNSARKDNFQLKFTVAELTSNLTRARYNLKIVQQSEKKYFDRWVSAQSEIEAIEKVNATIKQEHEELTHNKIKSYILI